MIQHPGLLAVALVAVVLAVRRAARTPALQWLFAVTPVPFWCYLLPMVGTTAGWWPARSPLYQGIAHHLLPVCLVLLLLGTDLRAVARLGRQALTVMLAGAAGILLGMVAAMGIVGHWLPAGAWQGLGALAGSWTGGSMNLLAVKEALGMPDAAIAPVILVDTLVAYGWMGGLLLLSHRHGRPARPAGPPAAGPPLLGWSMGRGLGLAVACGVALLVSWGAQTVSNWLPAGAAIGPATWTILLVTTGALGLSLTPLARLERDYRLSELGMVLLFLLLATIGARVNLQAFGQSPSYLAAGLIAVAVHALVLLLVGWRVGASWGLVATASQANIGGVVSAPLVGAAFAPALAPIGLLMAVLGNVVGTYVGLATAALGRALSAG